MRDPITFDALATNAQESAKLGQLLLQQVRIDGDTGVFVKVDPADECDTDRVANMSTAYTEGSTGFMKLTSAVSKLVSPTKIILYYKIKKNGSSSDNAEERAIDLTGVTLDAVKSGNYDGLVEGIARVILGDSPELLQGAGAIPPEPHFGMSGMGGVTGLPFGWGVARAAGKPAGTPIGESLTALVQKIHPNYTYVGGTGSVFAESTIEKGPLIAALADGLALPRIKDELPDALKADIEEAIKEKLNQVITSELYSLINFLFKY